MAGWNGSGVFSRTYNWVQDQINGIGIRADRHDANDTDFVNGINNCLTKDGQNSPSANLPMATYKHTNVGKATALNQYATAEQIIDSELIYYTASGTDTYTITPSPAITAYAAGQSFLVKFTNANTGAATLNVNSLGAAALEDRAGNALIAGAIAAGAMLRCDHDGTNFQVTQAVFNSFGNISISSNTISSTNTDGNIVLDPNGTGAIDLDSDVILVGQDIQHDGDTDNKIVFGTDTQDFQTGGSSRLDVSDSGVRFGGANARITTILDEDNMASDSATALATQQSIKAYADTKGITLGTPVVTTSGSTIDFASLPAGIKRLTVMFNGVSLSGTDDIYIYLGDAGGVETTGYTGRWFITGIGSDPWASGVEVPSGNASNIINGFVTFNLENSSSFSWSINGTVALSTGTSQVAIVAGTKSVSAVLDRVQIITSGTNTFDAGEINISYEL